jgi:hypothetical protein
MAHIMLPIGAGLVALLPGSIAALSHLIMVVSILAGLLLTVLVPLMELRGRIRRGEDKRAVSGDRDTRNVDFTYHAAHYTIVAGVVIIASLILQEHATVFLTRNCLWVGKVGNAVMVMMVVHFALAFLHCLRRLRRCYEVFGVGNR